MKARLPEIQREAMLSRLEEHWARQVERIAAALDLDELGQGLPDVYGAVDTEAELQALTPVIQAHMQEVATAAALEVLEEWDPEGENWSPDMIEGWIAKAAATNSARWMQYVEGQLSAAAAEPDWFEKLGVVLAGAGPLVALAPSFATEAASFGGHDAAKKTGLQTKTWTIRGVNTRPEHAALSGVTVPIGDSFPNGMRWPGDFTGDVSQVASCNCTLKYGKD